MSSNYSVDIRRFRRRMEDYVRRSLFAQDHEDFRDSVRSYVGRTIAPHFDEFVARRAIDRSAWRAAGTAGLLGLDVPDCWGGSGAQDFRFNAVLTEELASVSAGMASAFSIHCDIVTPYLVDLTTDEQKQRWLPGMVSGEIVTALAMSEPSAGSDIAAIRATAHRDGAHWVLNGSKTFITNGFGADLVLVAAKTNPELKARGISLFAVENGTEGFTRGRKLDKIGQPEADTAELFFDEVRLTDVHVVGEVDRGFQYMMERLPQERLSAAVANVAHAAKAVAITLDYARARTAFGTRIGSFQHNKFLLAELQTKVDVARAYVDACVDAHTRTELTAVDAAKAKWWSAQIENEVLDACVQLHGGYGYMREYWIAQAWADARVTKIWAGTNEIMKEIIGRDLGL
jgi:long-chain-acyl-CoA dehydrogenase